MRKLLILFGILLLAATSNAQHREDWDDDYSDFRLRFPSIEKPSIQVSYGLTNIKFDGYTQDFDNAAVLDLKIGFSTKEAKRRFRHKLLESDFYYFQLGNFSSDVDFRDKSESKINVNNWRFGFGNRSGYVIKAGGLGILPYTSSSILWTNSNLKGVVPVTLPEEDKLLNYGSQFRFGAAYESGLSFQVSRLLSFDVNYERSNVYSRYMFWAQSGSMALQEAGIGVIDYFVKRVLRNDPVAGSIVNFVLKSAYYYGFNELKSKEMNWPFGGEAAVNYSSFKFVTGFTF